MTTPTKETWKVERDERLAKLGFGAKPQDAWPQCTYCGQPFNPITSPYAEHGFCDQCDSDD